MVFSFFSCFGFVDCVFFFFGSRCTSTVPYIFCRLFDTLAVVVIGKVISCQLHISFISVYLIGVFSILWMNVKNHQFLRLVLVS